MIQDLKEQVVEKVRKRIEAPIFKSKIEVARLVLKEYEKAEGTFYKKKLSEIRKRLEALEVSSTKNKNQVNPEDFNNGYKAALTDYCIFTKEQIKVHCCGRQKVWKPICSECKHYAVCTKDDEVKHED